MDQAPVSPGWAPFKRLLHTVLVRIHAELGDPSPVSVSVSAASAGSLVRLITIGEGAELSDVQVEHLGGPIPDAIRTGVPIAVADLWSDPRWPGLTRAAVTASHPDLTSVWSQIQGMAVLPVGHLEHSTIVLCCCLPKPAGEDTLEALGRYKQLVEAAIAVGHATAGNGPEQVLHLLSSRAIIEQAKGAIIATAGVGGLEAWRILRETSQHNNVKLRELAVALVETLGGEPAEQPLGSPAAPIADARAVKVARAMWQQLSTSAPSSQHI